MRFSQPLLTAVLLLAPAAARAGDDVTKLPGKCEECQIAGGGRYLVMKLANTRPLSVYDATTQKLSKLDVAEDDIVYGAGGDTVLVYLRNANELQTWSLETGKMVKSKDFLDKPNVQTIVMGHSRGNLALMRMGRSGNGGFSPDTLIDTTVLKSKEMKVQQQPQQQFQPGFNPGMMRNWDKSQMRANGDMSRMVEWGAVETPNGFMQIAYTESGYQYAAAYNMPASLIPGDDGRLYTPLGNTLEYDPTFSQNVINPGMPHFNRIPFKMSTAIKGKTLVPAIGAQFSLAVSREGSLTLYQARSETELAKLEDFPGWAPAQPVQNFNGFMTPNGLIRPEDLGPGAYGEGQNPLTLDRRICFVPGMDHILFVPHSNDRIVQRKFDLKATLNATGEDYLVVLSAPQLRTAGGGSWAYELKTVAKHGPVKYELAKAPEGMTVTAGKLTWTTPKGIIGRAPVEIQVTDAKGKVVRQTFEISFE